MDRAGVAPVKIYGQAGMRPIKPYGGKRYEIQISKDSDDR